MKLRISMKEAVFTVDTDNDGEAEVPADREGETKAPEVDIDDGLDDSNNDGKTDSPREISPEEPDAPEMPKDEPGDEELIDALSALEEQVMEAIKKIIHETQE